MHLTGAHAEAGNKSEKNLWKRRKEQINAGARPQGRLPVGTPLNLFLQNFCTGYGFFDVYLLCG